MAKQTINIGSTANDGTGSTLRVGGDLINDNFNEIYTAFGDGSTLSNAIPGKVEGANFTSSILVGHSTTGALNAAEHNTGVGIGALDALTSGDKNTAIGKDSMTATNTGSENVALGNYSLLAQNSGNYNTAIGVLTLRYVTNGQFNSVVGYRSHQAGNGSYNTALGYYAGGNTSMSGSYNTSIGYQSGMTITSGEANLSIGNKTEPLSATGDNQLTIGTYDGTTTTTWIRGDSSGNLSLAGDVTVGDDLNLTTDSTVINFGADSDTTLTHVADSGLQLNSTRKMMFNDASQYIMGADGYTLLLVGAAKIELNSPLINLIGNLNTTGTINAANFKQEGTNFTNSLLVGHSTTGTLNGASNNTGIGIGALDGLTGGDNNVAVGYNAGTAIVGGYRNTTVGGEAGEAITNGFSNTTIGNQSGKLITGNSNITIGKGAGDNITSGDGNVIIGSIDADSATGDTQLIIADGTDGSVAWIKGDSSGNVTMTLAANQITSTQLTGATNLQILASDGTVLKTLFGAGS